MMQLNSRKDNCGKNEINKTSQWLTAVAAAATITTPTITILVTAVVKR